MATSADRGTPQPFPERVGRYELLLPLGAGGMATVYLARARGAGGFERDVALKLLHAHLRSDEESKLHLLEEAKLAARIRHPNVVPVFEVDDDPFGLYLVMEYIEGETLSGLIHAAEQAGEPLPKRVAARILSDALLGLHAAHELTDENGHSLGLVHRDFSPQNVLVGVDGVSRLSDFGVAKAAGRAVRTKTGLVKGKVAYMAPEQARGRDVDRRCDVWAGGVIAWELVAGRRLHEEDDDVATLLSVVTEEPMPLGVIVPDVPEVLEAAVDAALTSEVRGRCPTALELRQRLDQGWRELDGIAEAEEVAEFMARIVGPKLAKRRQRIAEVRELRARMGEIVRADVETPDAKQEGSEGQAENLPSTRLAIPRLSTTGSVARPAIDVPLTSRVVRAAERRSSTKRWILSGTIATLSIAGLVVAAQVSSGPSTEPEPARLESAPVPVALEPSSPRATSNTVYVPPAAEPKTAPAPATEAPAPKPKPRRAVRALEPRGPAPVSAPSDRTEPAPPRARIPTKLAADPYGPQ